MELSTSNDLYLSLVAVDYAILVRHVLCLLVSILDLLKLTAPQSYKVMFLSSRLCIDLSLFGTKFSSGLVIYLLFFFFFDMYFHANQFFMVFSFLWNLFSAVLYIHWHIIWLWFLSVGCAFFVRICKYIRDDFMDVCVCVFNLFKCYTCFIYIL